MFKNSSLSKMPYLSQFRTFYKNVVFAVLILLNYYPRNTRDAFDNNDFEHLNKEFQTIHIGGIDGQMIIGEGDTGELESSCTPASVSHCICHLYCSDFATRHPFYIQLHAHAHLIGR